MITATATRPACSLGPALASARAGSRGRFGVSGYAHALDTALRLRLSTGVVARPVEGPDGWSVEVSPSDDLPFSRDLTQCAGDA